MAAPERRGRDGPLKSSFSTRREEETRARRHRVDSPRGDGSSSWLLIHQTHPAPQRDGHPRHTPQLDPHMERVCVCVSQRGGGTRAECVACVVVFATCCRIIPWELCVCKGGCFLRDPSSDDAPLLLVKRRISVLRDAERNERKTATQPEEAREDG